MVMCDCISNTNNNINITGPKNANTLPELISPGKSNQCRIEVVGTNGRKKRRTPGSGSRWSGGTWTGSWTGTATSSSTRWTTRGRRRLDSSVEIEPWRVRPELGWPHSDLDLYL